MSRFYDGTQLLSKKDLKKRQPEIFLAAGNRSSGKTTWFNKKLVDDFKEKGKKFGLLYRFQYELDDVPDKFFKDINGLFFPNDYMTSKSMMKGVFQNLYLNDEHCGYAISINSADQIKKLSHFFSDMDHYFFDEFQSETGKYCPDEIKKFISIHTSIARGNGKHVRYVPVYMASNCVSLLNPYYSAMGISDRLNKETKFLRGNGYVLQQSFMDAASIAQLQSGFNQAFINEKYISYGSENVYLNDSNTFIETPKGKSRYICNIRYLGKDFSVKTFDQEGVAYCDTKVDRTFPFNIATTTADHNINYVMLKSNSEFVWQLRYYFEKGCFRFKNLQAKEALMKTITYY